MWSCWISTGHDPQQRAHEFPLLIRPVSGCRPALDRHTQTLPSSAAPITSSKFLND